MPKRKIPLFLLCIMTALLLVIPLISNAQETGSNIVRAGWFEGPYYYTDSYGRHSGYAYEYQQKIAAYTGWKYEYIEDSWPNLLEKLKSGDIDLLSGIPYTEESTSQMLFSSLPMGSAAYHVYILPGSSEIIPGDSASLQSRKVGICQDSVQKELLLFWAENNGVQPDIIELTGSNANLAEMLEHGEIDAFVATDSQGNTGNCVPAFNIGRSDSFFAVSSSRPDLLNELNTALSKIQNENISGTLSADEMNWLSAHGAIRVGYSSGYMPFCGTDSEAGGLTGALHNYLELVSDSLPNSDSAFSAVPYTSLDSALNALNAGEIDCLFPVSLSAYDAEELDVSATTPIMETEMYAVVRKSEKTDNLTERKLTVAVAKDSFNDELFLKAHYPDWNTVSCDGLEDGFREVFTGKADCMLINSYQIAQTESLRKRNNLTLIPTGKTMTFSFAVRPAEGELYQILSRTASLVPAASIETSLQSYSWPEVHFALTDYLSVIIAVILTIVSLVLLVMYRSTKRIKLRLEDQLSVQEQLLAKETRVQHSDIMLNAMTSDYHTLFRVDLDKDEAVCYRSDEKTDFGFKEGESFPYHKQFVEFANRYVPETDRQDFLNFIFPDMIRTRVNREGVISHRFLSIQDGEERYIQIRIAGINPSEDGVHEVALAISDVDSETRESLSQKTALNDALSAAETANKSKSSFLSRMSHEIRTPMNAIIGLDDLALRDETLSEQARDYLEKIGDSARHLLGLINDILDMNRIESGSMSLRREEFAFNTMLEQINTTIMPQCSDKGLTYECHILSPLDDYYIGDSQKLREVLVNILTNSVKFTDAPGSVTMTVARTGMFEDKSTLRFCIKDTSDGIDEELIPKLFEAFAQEDGDQKNRFGNSGLSMSITKSIVELMDGSITVESEKGAGTEFTIMITLKNCVHTAAAPGEQINLNNMYVLVVDDNVNSAKHAKMVLDKVGIDADMCNSGPDALRMIDLQYSKNKPYHLVLMDCNMPGMNGLETTEKIKAKYGSGIAVIILTAYNWDYIQEEAEQVGVDSFLVKPLFPANVIQEFEQVVRKNNIKLTQEKPRAELAGRRILLAEDMEINADIMMDLLSLEDVEADHAENGRIAVKMFTESPVGKYSAILMDVRMPEMNGLEASKAIRALDREDARQIPIIALTANAFDEDVKYSLQAGMNAHLNKPVESDQLFQILGELIYEVESSK